MKKIQPSILWFVFAGLLVSGCGIFSSSKELTREDHFNLGKKLLDENDNAAALDELELAVEGDKEDFQEEAEFLLAEAQFRNKWYYPAFRQYKKHLEDYPLTPRLEIIEDREFSMAVDLLKGKGRTFLGIHIRETEGLGVDILNHIIVMFPTGKHAVDSRRILAGYYFDNGDWADAMLEYEELRKKCPDSIWTALADYRIALCNLNQSRGYGYDRNILLRAKEELQNYLLFHPEGAHLKDAKKKIGEIDNQLAQKDLAIAEFYLSRGESQSAEMFLTALIREYPESTWAEKGKHLLALEKQARLRDPGPALEKGKEETGDPGEEAEKIK